MAVSSIHGPYAVGFGATPTMLGGIMRQSFSPGIGLAGESQSDELYARVRAIAGAAPSVGFTTTSIEEVFDDIGISAVSGLNLASSNLKLYHQKRAASGTRAGSTSHRQFTFATGLLVPGSLNVSHQGNATIDLVAALVSSDGSASPVTIGEGVTLPASVAGMMFTMGPVTVAGVTFDQCRSFSIDFGLRMQAESADSNVYPTHVSIASVAPSLTFRGVKSEWFKASGGVDLGGLAPTHANTTIYLRKRASGGTYVDDGDSEHVKFTAAGLLVLDDAFDQSTNEPGEVSLRLETVYDGTNAPLVVTAPSTIT